MTANWFPSTRFWHRPHSASVWFGHKNGSSTKLLRKSGSSGAYRRQTHVSQDMRLQVISENDSGNYFELSAGYRGAFVERSLLVSSTAGSLLLVSFNWRWLGNACTQLCKEWDSGEFRISCEAPVEDELWFVIAGGNKPLPVLRKSLEETWAGRILVIGWTHASRFRIAVYLVQDIGQWICNSATVIHRKLLGAWNRIRQGSLS